MKQFFRTVILLLATLLPAIAAAYDFEVDGIYYNINGSEATVTNCPPIVDEYGEVIEGGFTTYSGDVTIPATVSWNGNSYTVTAIGEEAFRNCNVTSVSIPATVTVIERYAFECCTNMTSVNIPEGVTYIGDRAFLDCEQITSLTIPNALTTIGESTFACCYSLTSITIPNSVTEITEYGFYGCTGLTSIFIPKSVTSIGDFAFGGCSSVTSITVDSANPDYDSRNDCNAIIETSTNTLIAGCQTTIIPNTVSAIGNGAFTFCSELTNIVIPNSITRLGYGAFSFCQKLTSITIPNSVSEIGHGAFQECTMLNDVYSHIESPSLVTVGDYAFMSGVYGVSNERILHVPLGSAAAYQASPDWEPYFGKMIEFEQITVHKGDVNDDGSIDIADVSALIDMLLFGE